VIVEYLKTSNRCRDPFRSRAKRYSKRVSNIQDKKFTFHMAKSPVYSAGKKGGLEMQFRFQGERLKFLRRGTA
jgi:hypothetical protein